MKATRISVFNALKEVGLINGNETLENVIEKGIVFTNAVRNEEIRDALYEIEDISLNGECFSGFSNGILLTIKPFSY